MILTQGITVLAHTGVCFWRHWKAEDFKYWNAAADSGGCGDKLKNHCVHILDTHHAASMVHSLNYSLPGALGSCCEHIQRDQNVSQNDINKLPRARRIFKADHTCTVAAQCNSLGNHPVLAMASQPGPEASYFGFIPRFAKGAFPEGHKHWNKCAPSFKLSSKFFNRELGLKTKVRFLKRLLLPRQRVSPARWVWNRVTD